MSKVLNSPFQKFNTVFVPRLLDCKHEEYVHAIHKQKTWDKKYDDQSKQNKQKRYGTDVPKEVVLIAERSA